MNESTALVNINPQADSQVVAFYTEALGLQKYAEARVIKTAEDLKPATNDLSIIAKVKKGMEERRKEYLKPLQDHVKAINTTFVTLMAPIEIADKLTRDKILAFHAEQERIRKEQEEINRKRMEAAEAEMRLKGELTEPVNLVEVIPLTPTRTQTDVGSAGMRDNWKYEVVDFKAVPDDYKMINTGVLTPIVKASKGKITIPGIRIFNEPILAVNTK